MGPTWWWLRCRWSNSMWIVRCVWKKRDHEGVVCLHDDLENLREGRRFACRSWTVPFVEDRPRWRSITRVSSYGGLGDRCERSIGRSADTWTASRQCACGSGVLTHRNARIATHNPPNCTCTAFLLCASSDELSDVSSWYIPSCNPEIGICVSCASYQVDCAHGSSHGAY